MPDQLKKKIEATWKKHCSQGENAERLNHFKHHHESSSSLFDNFGWSSKSSKMFQGSFWIVVGAHSCEWFGFLVRETHRSEMKLSHKLENLNLSSREIVQLYIYTSHFNLQLSKNFRQTRNGWGPCTTCHGRFKDMPSKHQIMFELYSKHQIMFKLFSKHNIMLKRYSKHQDMF